MNNILQVSCYNCQLKGTSRLNFEKAKEILEFDKNSLCNEGRSVYIFAGIPILPNYRHI